ncbi:uncharacterized protein LOC130751246 isoform X2 [Actinidia eriantha]|uniref:uncharacterized protein LOC130751246 isoform X2 n=1 Tax=Actinidia eriantha TaxID=165200 RepID=UPI00258DA027|nr:uncharacterized protein LOC130751246 isoform X2 [Actinidia eriantha]
MDKIQVKFLPFEFDAVRSSEVQKLGLKPSEKVFDKLENIGQQLALTFNKEGSLFALGGEVEIKFRCILLFQNGFAVWYQSDILELDKEDGKLRVLMWPAMEMILNEVHASVKDLDFRALVSASLDSSARVAFN